MGWGVLPEILVTALHLMMVNIAVGGTALILWLHVRSRTRTEAGVLGRRLLRIAIYGLYGGAVSGLVAAWLWWLGRPVETERVAGIVPVSRYYYAAAEFVFSLACFEGWSRWWDARRKTAWLLGFLGFTNLVYHFPTLFAILGVFSVKPFNAVRPPSYLTLLGDSEVLARFAHFFVASFAVGGTLAYALPQQPDDEARTADARERLQRRTALVALVATLLQWPLGIAVIVAMPEVARNNLLGDDGLLTAMFVGSLGAVVVLMHKLAAGAFGKTTPREARAAFVWLAVTIGLMTAVRFFSREALYVDSRPANAACTPVLRAESSVVRSCFTSPNVPAPNEEFSS